MSESTITAIEHNLIDHVLTALPTVQAVYLFGSYAKDAALPESDVDIALLLPPLEAAAVGFTTFGELQVDLEELFQREVDLINLRRVSTVFQKEVIMGGRRIYCGDEYATEEFEMLVLSYYQQLNEERAEILAEGLRSGRFYDV